MKTYSRRCCHTVLFAVLMVTTLPSVPQTSERVSVVAVDVPVQVTRKGEPVRGLTADDFQVLVDGKKVPIAAFDVHDVSLSVEGATSAGRTGEAPAAIPPRYFMLLFDLSFSDVGSLQRSKLAAREIVADSIDDRDLVAVTTYATTIGVRPLLNFTSDRAQVLAAIDSMGVNQPGGVDPLNLALVDPSKVLDGSFINDPIQQDEDARGTGLDLDEMAQQHLLEIQNMVGRADRSARGQQVGNLVRDFSGLARLLDSVRARKQVVYLSEGFENEMITATEDQSAQRAMSDDLASGRIWEVDVDQRFGDSTRQSQLDRMIDELRRSDCVVHTVDIGNPGVSNLEGRAGGRPSIGGNQGLSAMASGTGGTYQRNVSQIGKALRNILLETQVTYVLTFNANKIKKDGAFHKIKVKPVGTAKGAKVSHRPGFYAPGGPQQPEQMLFALGQQLMAANEGGAIPTEVLTMPFALDESEALIPILMEIDGKSLIGPQGAKQVGVQLFAYAVERETGSIRDFFSKTLGINVDAAGAAFTDTGLKFYGGLKLPAGEYDLRLLVVEPTSGRSNLRIVPLDVPDFASGAAELMPPLVPDPGGKWLLARVEPGEGESPDPFPFMAGQTPFLPGAHPTVKAGETLPLMLIGRNLGDSEPWATAELTDAAGNAVHTPGLSPLQTGRAGMTGYEAIRTALATDELAPGEYTLALTVAAGGDPLTRTIPLTVR
ncbi:MAG: VWA domain-containing protein [Acidobacteria bacterium]|nr:VWA domain-containing protein [Acidobacteriota bacterium]NIM63869.1 VWA domain-containing protein [Acidobacteriota bacterium]NIO60138.1 VWA domain-containing protein [Acidobacteriota bacterium]NIQ31202.1 VWA domain-containing protein [Acidobacteriota bacterium]NIQ86339.1 VWA domain-containing protein [Acidobacteriota bacterium]